MGLKHGKTQGVGVPEKRQRETENPELIGAVFDFVNTWVIDILSMVYVALISFVLTKLANKSVKII